MILFKDYTIFKWSDWLNELAFSVGDFYNSFNKFPNILEASEYTISQFEYMTEISPIGKEIMNADTGLIGNKTKSPKIREFTFKDQCTLVFHINNNFADKDYRLILKDISFKKKALIKNHTRLEIQEQHMAQSRQTRLII